MKKMLLVGDVGGTKTNLAIFPVHSRPTTPVAEHTFSSRNYSSLEFKNHHFVEAFTRKKRMSKSLSRIPVHIILNSKAALLGAARYGFDSLFTRRVYK